MTQMRVTYFVDTKLKRVSLPVFEVGPESFLSVCLVIVTPYVFLAPTALIKALRTISRFTVHEGEQQTP